MTPEERADGIVRCGFTERQARFLVTVLRHGGICLPRQYTAFAGIVYGQKTRKFFRRLVDEGHATTCRCFHNRATIYRLQGRALGAADLVGRSGLSRRVPAAAVVPRIMLLDVVLGRPGTVWLTGGAGSDPSVDPNAGAAERVVPPAILAGYGRNRHFLDTLRIGIEPDGCPVFLFSVTEQSAISFRSLLRYLRPLLETLPAWCLLLACSGESARAAVACEEAARRNLGGCTGSHRPSSGGPARTVERYLLPHRYSHLIPLSSGPAKPRESLQVSGGPLESVDEFSA
jgi:hypothetical protein